MSTTHFTVLNVVKFCYYIYVDDYTLKDDYLDKALQKLRKRKPGRDG